MQFTHSPSFSSTCVRFSKSKRKRKSRWGKVKVNDRKTQKGAGENLRQCGMAEVEEEAMLESLMGLCNPRQCRHEECLQTAFDPVRM